MTKTIFEVPKWLNLCELCVLLWKIISVFRLKLNFESRMLWIHVHWRFEVLKPVEENGIDRRTRSSQSLNEWYCCASRFVILEEPNGSHHQTKDPFSLRKQRSLPSVCGRHSIRHVRQQKTCCFVALRLGRCLNTVGLIRLGQPTLKI